VGVKNLSNEVVPQGNCSLFEQSEFEQFRRSEADLVNTNYSGGVFGSFLSCSKKERMKEYQFFDFLR